MGKDRLARRKHRLEKRAEWTHRGHDRVVRAFAKWGLGDLRMPAVFVDALAATTRRRIFPARIDDPALAAAARAIEAALAEPFDGAGDLTPAEFFEVVVPSLLGLTPDWRRLAGTTVWLRILELLDETIGTFQEERVRRARRVAFEHTRIAEGVVFFVESEERRFALRMRRLESQSFEIDEKPRRVWRVAEWPEGPVYVQAHALMRLEERLPYRPGDGQMAMLGSLFAPSIVERRGHHLKVAVRVGELKVGYLIVLELAPGSDGKRRHLVRTFETLGMRGTPEGRRLRQVLSEEEIRRMGLDRIDAYANDDVQGMRPKLERLGLGANFALAEELAARRSA